jgi:hypothetical protein
MQFVSNKTARAMLCSILILTINNEDNPPDVMQSGAVAQSGFMTAADEGIVVWSLLLRFLTAQGEGAVVSREALAHQFPAELDRTLDFLTRRELIEPTDGGYRFQVELIRRWFARQVE